MKQKLTLVLVCLFALLTKATATVDSDLMNLVTKPSNVTITSLTNDPTYPWEKQEDGSFKRNGNLGNYYKYKISEITLEMTCTHPTYISFGYVQSFYSNSSSDESRTYRDGVLWTSNNLATAEGKTNSMSYILEPGTHTIKFALSSYYGNNATVVTLKSIKIEDLEDKYIKINLSAPGTLGEEALEKVATLPDMRYLKISGAMNADDWAKIKQMTNLQALDMTDVPITEIPTSAFANNYFSYYAFPKTLKKIGQEAFYNRNLSGTITLPEGLEEIGYRALYGNKIFSCKLPSTVTTLANTVFCNNKYLQNFTFNSNITIIPSSFLENCTSLQTVSGLENVNTFNNYCFSGCTALTSIGTTKPKTIYDYAFNNCKSLQAFDFSEITSIGTSAFYNCDSFNEINLPNISSLGDQSFYDCDGITKVTLSDKISTIPYYSFYGCDNLQEVILGTSVSSFGTYAFEDCRQLTKIYCNAPAPPSVNSNYPFYYTIPTSATLYVPEYAMSSYKLDPYWSKFTSVDKNPNPTTSLTLSKALTLTSGIRITGTPDITINSSGKMTINGDAEQTVGKFLAYCQNDNTNSASIISRCANMTSTSSEVRYYTNSGYWYFICMPFDVKVSDITATNGAAFVVRYYDSASRANGNSGNWKDVASDATLKAGQGYIFSVSTACYTYFPATDATHNAVFESTAKKTTLKTYATSTSADANWNLIGNPYLAYYDIYYMDYSAPITVWNTSNKTYSAYSVADDDFVLLPLQAFFVQKPDAVSAITFNPLGRQHNTTIDHSASAAKGEFKSRMIINLTLSNGETEDATRVVVNPMATDDYDMGSDASKMMTMETTPQLYTIAGDIQYAINEGEQASGKVQIGMWMPAAGTYTISAPRADADIQILDNGTPVTLPYTFEANEGTDDNRFVMVINNNATSNHELRITNYQNANAESPVYDLTGRRVSNTSKGVYIINNKKVAK